MTDIPKSRLLTTGAAARELGVSVNTVKRWAAGGHLELVRLPSGHHRVPASEVMRLRESGSKSLSLRRAGYLEGARLQQESRSERPGLDEVLAWVDRMVRLAKAQPHPPQSNPEDTARQVRRVHRMLRRGAS